MKRGVTTTQDTEKTQFRTLVFVNVLFLFFVCFETCLHCMNPEGRQAGGRLGSGGGGFRQETGRAPEGLWTRGLTLAVNT